MTIFPPISLWIKLSTFTAYYNKDTELGFCGLLDFVFASQQNTLVSYSCVMDVPISGLVAIKYISI